MEGRVGKGVITTFLCLVVLSALVFVAVENRKFSKAQSGPNRDYPLVEVVDPWVFTDVMADYEYDLYRMGPHGLEFVPPPAFEYAEASSLDSPTLHQLSVATDQIDPASRETTIKFCIGGVGPNPPCSNPNNTNAILDTAVAGTPILVTYEITPAVKTVIITDPTTGTIATKEVQILPAMFDGYLAVRTPAGNIVFLDRLSSATKKFHTHPVPYVSANRVVQLFGVVGGFRLDSRNNPGYYKLYGVMVPPGANVLDQGNWISNLVAAKIKYGMVD